MPEKCRRCGMRHMFGNCDDGIHCTSKKSYPKWRLWWRAIYQFLWKYLRIDLSMLLNKKNKESKIEGELYFRR